jgi:hypothetical protein
MQAWKKNDSTSFNFYDAHDLNNLMPYSSEDTIKAKLAERLRNTKVFVLLVGNRSHFSSKPALTCNSEYHYQHQTLHRFYLCKLPLFIFLPFFRV